MPTSKLPKAGTPEEQRVFERVKAGEAEAVARELEYQNRDSLLSALRRRGFRVSDYRQVGEIQLPTPDIIQLPEIQLREYKAPKRRRGDEEEAILHTGDGHADKVTPSYNADVYLARMDTMFDSIMTIVTLHRNMYPIRTLRIVDTGDNVQGENPFQGSKVGTITMGVRDQIAKLALPAWVKLICSLKQEFEEVEFDGFPGNHGYERLAPETSRADLSLYDLLRAKIGDKKGITINIHEAFGEIITILGWKFFVFHGDGIPCQQGVPFFALDRKLKSWHMQYGGFNYALSGHFHKRHSDEISSLLEYFMCGSLVSDDDWALKKLGISSNPSQNLMGVHPRMGITWRYGLLVDRKPLSQRLPSIYADKGGE